MGRRENGQLATLRSVTISMPWTIQSYLLFLLMISSGLGATLTYLEIDKLVDNNNSLVEAFPLGDARYTIRSGGQCVGYVDFVTEQEAGSLTINGTGNIRVKSDDQQIELTLEMQASFNALRQLGGSYLKVQSPEISVLVSSLNIRPVEITAKVLRPTLGDIFRTEIAGPIVYQKEGEEQVSIKGPQIHDSFANLKLVSQQPFLREVSIARTYAPDDAVTCLANSGALNIRPILALSETFAALLPQGMVP